MFPRTLISATIQGTFRLRREWKDAGSVTGVDGSPDASAASFPNKPQGAERSSRRRLLDFDLRKAQTEAVTRLGRGQLGQGLDGDDHILGGHRGTERHGELR